MEFRILGPLEVLEGDRLLDLGGQRQRGLLALLLLHANQVVSSSRLIEELWPEEASESHAGALQASVSRLRKLLGTGAELLVTLPTGYRLELAPEQLDLDRFERLVQEAGDAEPQEAAERLREALALWRGPALADFAYEPFAQAAIGRLEEVHLLAVEMRDRRRPRPRPPRRARRGARSARGRAPPARAPARPADARALPVGTPGRGARRVPDRPPHARRRAGDRAERGAAGAGARHAAPGSGARTRADDGPGAFDPGRVAGRRATGIAARGRGAARPEGAARADRRPPPGRSRRGSRPRRRA